MRVLSAMVLIAVSASAQAADKSAICAGLAGKWSEVANIQRQADGSWQSDLSEPDWQVEQTGPGKCKIVLEPKGEMIASLDTTSGNLVWTPWQDGKPGVSAVETFVRTEIGDSRSWMVEILDGSGKPGQSVHRFTMIMADDQYAITRSDAATAAGPFQLQSYTTHRRRP